MTKVKLETTLQEHEIINIEDPFESADSCDDPDHCEIKIQSIAEEGNALFFDITGFSAPIMNCLRRTLLGLVPGVAFDKISIYNNTSIIPDEMLAHRLGLIPLKIDPRLISFPDCPIEGIPDSIQFKMEIKCDKSRESQANESVPIMSDSLTWYAPKADRDRLKKHFKEPPKVVHDDILVAKLRPGQIINVVCDAYKGVGSDHAKFSNVCTAFYRLLPVITIKEPVVGDDAETLQKCFSKGVIKIVEKDGEKVAEVDDPYHDTGSRNIMKYPHISSKVSIGRNKHYHIFSVESSGSVPSSELVLMAFEVMKAKCEVLLDAINNLESPTEEPATSTTTVKSEKQTSKSKKSGASK